MEMARGNDEVVQFVLREESPSHAASHSWTCQGCSLDKDAKRQRQSVKKLQRGFPGPVSLHLEIEERMKMKREGRGDYKAAI